MLVFTEGRWMKIVQTLELKYSIHFSALIESSEASVPNELKDNQYPMTFFSVGKDYL